MEVTSQKHNDAICMKYWPDEEYLRPAKDKA